MKPDWSFKRGCVIILPASTHSHICCNNIQKQAAKNNKKTSEIYQPAISDYQPLCSTPPCLHSSVIPPFLFWFSTWHPLYPLLPLSLSSLKAESLLLRSDLSPSLCFSPPLCSFSCPVHIMNDWKMCTVLSALVCLRERTQFHRRRLTLKENGTEEREADE